VILSLAIFALSAGVLLSALSVAREVLERSQRRAEAVDLAVSLLAGIEAGQIEPIEAGPEAVDPDWGPEGWSWSLRLEQTARTAQDPQATQLHLRVQHDESGQAYSLVQWWGYER
jgi:hypothetical protein